MQCSRFAAAAAVLLLAGCSTQSSMGPAEVLDERTGMTVGELRKPIELTQSVNVMPAESQSRHVSFAYMGPIEWDRSGTSSYALWIHVAPGTDWQFAAIRSPGVVTLVLDDARSELKPIEPPALAQAPYRPVASWGQTAYFDIDFATLKRMASSATIVLEVKTGSGTAVRFSADPSARAAMAHYVAAQGY